jgi:hypothetical protein
MRGALLDVAMCRGEGNFLLEIIRQVANPGGVLPQEGGDNIVICAKTGPSVLTPSFFFDSRG